jgi:hypothetical protein
MTYGSGSTGACTTADWYGGGVVDTCDRGRRSSLVNNYGDYTGSGQPVTLSGTVNTSGTTVTLVSENLARDFSTCPNTDWPTAGTCWWIGLTGGKFVINGVGYNVASYTDATHIELTATAGTQSGVAFTSPNPFVPLIEDQNVFQPEDLPGVFFQGVAPDGFTRMTTVDGAATSCWFSQGTKTGYITLFAMGAGDVAYANASIGSTRAAIEMQVFSDTVLGAGVSGATAHHKVYPTTYIDLTDDLPLGTFGQLPNGAPTGYGQTTMSCDYETGDIYIRVSQAGESRVGQTNYDRLYHFACTSCAAPVPVPLMPLPLAASVGLLSMRGLVRRWAA